MCFGAGETPRVAVFLRAFRLAAFHSGLSGSLLGLAASPGGREFTDAEPAAPRPEARGGREAILDLPRSPEVTPLGLRKPEQAGQAERIPWTASRTRSTTAPPRSGEWIRTPSPWTGLSRSMREVSGGGGKFIFPHRYPRFSDPLIPANAGTQVTRANLCGSVADNPNRGPPYDLGPGVRRDERTWGRLRRFGRDDGNCGCPRPQRQRRLAPSRRGPPEKPCR